MHGETMTSSQHFSSFPICV